MQEAELIETNELNGNPTSDPRSGRVGHTAGSRMEDETATARATLCLEIGVPQTWVATCLAPMVRPKGVPVSRQIYPSQTMIDATFKPRQIVREATTTRF